MFAYDGLFAFDNYCLCLLSQCIYVCIIFMWCGSPLYTIHWFKYKMPERVLSTCHWNNTEFIEQNG